MILSTVRENTNHRNKENILIKKVKSVLEC